MVRALASVVSFESQARGRFQLLPTDEECGP